MYSASTAVTLGIVGIASFILIYHLVTPASLEEANVWERNRTYGMIFYDMDGEEMTHRGAFQGDILNLDEMPAYLPAAFLAIEDRRFYRHGAIDPKGLLRAFWINFRAGRTVQGGSTITQQLAKNLFLSNDRTYSRKFKEVFLALWLEKHLTKDEILTLYLNRIYMGASTYGVDAAARLYFGKSAREVSIAEAAMLAGLPKAPSRFAPTNSLQNARARASVVLQSLLDTGVLTRSQVRWAEDNPPELADHGYSPGQNYFIDHIVNEIARLIGQPEQTIHVYTTLSQNLQETAESIVHDQTAQYSEDLNVSQAGMVVMEANGALRAMVGGMDYFESQFNRAAQAKRQPGSAFKPFVYLAALNEGIEIDSVWQDEPTRIGRWEPKNYSDTYSGRVTMRQAFERSINTVAAKIGQEVGIDKVVEQAHLLGIQSHLSANPSLALGTEEVSVLEMTGAYLAFANTGMSATPHAVIRITDEAGMPLYEFEEPEAQRLIDREIAVQMNHLMYQVIHKGTGKRASLGSRPAAGKTGTSQEWRDAWFMGYTPNYVAGVWIGNDDNSPMNRVTGGHLPAMIWKEFMEDAHAGMRAKEIPGGYPARDNVESDELREYLLGLSERLDRVKAGRAIRSSKKKSRFPWN